MKEKRIDLILSIIESIICVFGVIVFTIAGVEVNEIQRFIFLIADFYCAIKLATCIDEIIDKIIFDYPVKSVSEWCIEKYKVELENNRLIIEKEKEARKALRTKKNK